MHFNLSACFGREQFSDSKNNKLLCANASIDCLYICFVSQFYGSESESTASLLTHGKREAVVVIRVLLARVEREIAVLEAETGEKREFRFLSCIRPKRTDLKTSLTLMRRCRLDSSSTEISFSAACGSSSSCIPPSNFCSNEGRKSSNAFGYRQIFSLTFSECSRSPRRVSHIAAVLT